jgi:hypothetical protein
MFERIACGNSCCHCHSDNHSLPDFETIEQSRKVEHLIAQGIAVSCQFALAVTAPIVCNASIKAAQMCDLLFEHVDSMVLAMDEHDVGTNSICFVVNLATVYIRDRHTRLRKFSRTGEFAPTDIDSQAATPREEFSEATGPCRVQPARGLSRLQMSNSIT